MAVTYLICNLAALRGCCMRFARCCSSKQIEVVLPTCSSSQQLYHGKPSFTLTLPTAVLRCAAGNHAAGSSADGLAGVMVATDLAARGLDFPGTIDHVINFDMPSNAIDYLHRYRLLPLSPFWEGTAAVPLRAAAVGTFA